MARIGKAIILAGGLGTRLLPITHAVPKEMLPLGRKPILHYIVDELKGAGIEEVIIVSRKGKTAISEYFKREQGVRIIEKEKALGPGHSVLAAREYIGDENFLVAFGDAPYAGAAPEEFIRKMLDTHLSLRPSAVVAAQKVPRSESHLRGIIETAGPLEEGKPALVASLVQKPMPSVSPEIWGLAGRFVLAPAVFGALEAVASRAESEILLVDAIDYMLREGARMIALPLGEGLHRYDTGSWEGYFEAFQKFSSDYHRNQ